MIISIIGIALAVAITAILGWLNWVSMSPKPIDKKLVERAKQKK